MTRNTRHLILIQFLALILTLMGSVAMAQYESAVIKRGVNFRAGPGTNYDIKTVVPKGEVIEIIRQVGKWTQVRLDSGKKGYIYSKYIGRGSKYLPESEGGYCVKCHEQMGERQTGPAATLANDVLEAANPAKGFSACIMGKFEKGLKQVIAQKYGNRTRGKGKCQYAMRFGAEKAGLYPGGGFGNAKDTIAGWKRMGFVNHYKPGMTAKTAPSGSILVYDRAKRGARCKSSQGNTFGHIEYKKYPNEILYDAISEENIQTFYGTQCRPLIGVMIMGNKCPTCKASVVRSCGG